MKTKIIKPKNVCSQEFDVFYDEKTMIISDVKIYGGCQGNTQAVSKLLVGRSIQDAVSLLEGICCRGSRNGDTSCPDQLSKGLKDLL